MTKGNPDLPDTINISAVMPEGTTTREQFRFAIDHIVHHPEIDFKNWTVASRIEEMRSFEKASITTVPTEMEYDRLGEEQFGKGFAIETSIGQFIVRTIHDNLEHRPEADFFGYTSGWRLTGKLAACLMKPFDQKKYLGAISIYQDILRALIKEFVPKRAAIYRKTDSYYLGPYPPYAYPDVVVCYVDKTCIEETYISLDGFCSQWDKADLHHQNGLLLARDVHIIAESDYKMNALRRGMNLLRLAKASNLARFRGLYATEPSPYDQAKLDLQPSYIEQIGYNGEDKSLEFTVHVPKDEFLGPRDVFQLMDYAENGTVEGKEVEIIVLTFPTLEMAKREVPILSYLDYIKIQYLASNGEWKLLDY